MARKGERLIFPAGVRFPVDGEFPAGYESDREKIAMADITVGYVEMPLEGKAFKSYFEANVHATDVWRVFSGLVDVMFDDVAAPILCVKEEEPILGPYTDRTRAIEALEKHQYLLSNDGMWEFGLIFQHEGITEEVYVASEKYFKVWTNEPSAVKNVFAQFGLPQELSLEFIDEYPHISIALMDENEVPLWSKAIDELMEEFRKLPPRFPPETDR